MAFVLDASVTVTWAMADETHPMAIAAYHRLDSEMALVPLIWMYEVLNILLLDERRQRISIADSREFLTGLEQLPIEVDPAGAHPELTEIARRFRLTV
jgi:predicted nucleic acid-binding protein